MNKPIRCLILASILILFGLGLFPGQMTHAQSTGPSVLVLNAQGPVAPAMQLYIDRGLAYAADNHFTLIVIQLNTPGGAVDSMTQIQTNIRASTVPVVVYVSPNGAMAASAGTIITLSGHLAAMAPETTIGAASPVDASGQNINSTEELKLKEVMKATARGLMKNRPPEAVTLAENMIDNARAVTSSEALKIGMIDAQASDLTDLLAKLDGKTAFMPSGQVTLHLLGARTENLPQTLIEQALQIFTDPNLVFIFLSAGIWAIIIEVSSPGGWVAGFTGAVLLLLALFGMGILPVNWVGLLFIALSFLLFILDIKAPTHGALTVAGAASFVAGGLILFNSVRMPGVPPISVPLVVGTGIFLAGSFFAAVTIALRAQRAPVLTGRQAYEGKIGLVKQAVNPKGQIQVAGELWSARLAEGAAPLEIGERAEVLALDGVQMIVKRANESN